MTGIDTYALLQDDPTYPLFMELINRNRLTPIERADKTYELFVLLHKTSSTQRPILNGNSREFMSKYLNVSKSLISQYISIHKNILSDRVKEEMERTALAIRFSYLVSTVHGKNAKETEMLQLDKIREFTMDRKTTKYHQRRWEVRNS